MQNRIDTHKFILVAVRPYGIYVIGAGLFDTPEDAVAAYNKDHWRDYPRADYQIVVFQAVCELNEAAPACAPHMVLQPLGLPAPTQEALVDKMVRAQDAVRACPELTSKDEVPF